MPGIECNEQRPKLGYRSVCLERHVITEAVSGNQTQTERNDRPMRPNSTSPLCQACCKGDTDLVHSLLTGGTDVDAFDSNGFAAIHYAAKFGHDAVMTQLCHEGHCLVDLVNSNGCTALHIASQGGFSRCVAILLSCGANAFLANEEGFSASHFAVQFGHNQCCRLLLQSGCSTELKNRYGDTALHTATRYSHFGIVRILLSAGCNINEPNLNNDTALHIAAALRRNKIVEILKQSNADDSVANNQGETALDVAKRRGNQDIIALLNTSRTSSAPSQMPKRAGADSGAIHNSEGSSSTTSKKSSGFAKLKIYLTPWRKHNLPSSEEKSQGSKQVHFSDDSSSVHYSTSRHRRRHNSEGDKLSKEVYLKERQKSRLGFFDSYIRNDGMQYYRDLAGNVRQGPIGWAPVCRCEPRFIFLQYKMEKQSSMSEQRLNGVENKLLDRIDELSERTQSQIFRLKQSMKWQDQRQSQPELNKPHRRVRCRSNPPPHSSNNIPTSTNNSNHVDANAADVQHSKSTQSFDSSNQSKCKSEESLLVHVPRSMDAENAADYVYVGDKERKSKNFLQVQVNKWMTSTSDGAESKRNLRPRSPSGRKSGSTTNSVDSGNVLDIDYEPGVPAQPWRPSYELNAPRASTSRRSLASSTGHLSNHSASQTYRSEQVASQGSVEHSENEQLSPSAQYSIDYGQRPSHNTKLLVQNVNKQHPIYDHGATDRQFYSGTGEQIIYPVVKGRQVDRKYATVLQSTAPNLPYEVSKSVIDPQLRFKHRTDNGNSTIDSGYSYSSKSLKSNQVYATNLRQPGQNTQQIRESMNKSHSFQNNLYSYLPGENFVSVNRHISPNSNTTAYGDQYLSGNYV